MYINVPSDRFIIARIKLKYYGFYFMILWDIAKLIGIITNVYIHKPKPNGTKNSRMKTKNALMEPKTQAQV